MPVFRSIKRVLLLAVPVALLAMPGLADETEAADERDRVTVPVLGEFNTPMRSFAEMRFTGVVRQRMDFSCGSAALATMLTYYYDLPVDEITILADMYEKGNKEKIHKEGFSLLDMKTYLEGIGLRAEGYRESLDKLARVGIPAIVLIDHSDYTHFVVVMGVSGDRVLVGDPARGLRVYSRSEFQKMWNNIIFVILDQKEIARKHFNARDLWAKRRSETEIFNAAASLSTLTLSLTTPANYY